MTRPTILALLMPAIACAVMPCLVGCNAPASAADGGHAARHGSRHVNGFERGRRLMRDYQCTECHAIPGARSPVNPMGPPLAQFAQRRYIAGQLPNTRATLESWLQAPQAMVPGTDMPDTGVSPADARDMAAYLLTL